MNFLTKDEIHNVLEAAWRSSTRDWFMILLGYKHGMRATEIVNLKTTDIVDGHITIRRVKGSETNIQPLNPHTDRLLNEQKAFDAYMLERPKQWGDVLFQTNNGGGMTERWFYSIFRRYALAAGVAADKCHPHILKHSHANHLLRGGADITEVQKSLGHVSIANTMKYVKQTDEEVAPKVQTVFMKIF